MKPVSPAILRETDASLSFAPLSNAKENIVLMYRRGNCVNVGGPGLGTHVAEAAGKSKWYILVGRARHVPRHVRVPRFDVLVSVLEHRIRSQLRWRS